VLSAATVISSAGSHRAARLGPAGAQHLQGTRSGSLPPKAGKQAKPGLIVLEVSRFSGLHPMLVMTRTKKDRINNRNMLQGVIKHFKKADLRHKRVLEATSRLK
jgi:hypothetical protein